MGYWHPTLNCALEVVMLRTRVNKISTLHGPGVDQGEDDHNREQEDTDREEQNQGAWMRSFVVQDQVRHHQNEARHHRDCTDHVRDPKPGLKSSLTIKRVLGGARQAASAHTILCIGRRVPGSRHGILHEGQVAGGCQITATNRPNSG